MSTETKRHLAPKWLLENDGITQRQWRARKRRDLKNAIKSFDAYRIGCAYTPGINGEVGRIDAEFEKLKHALSAKEWK